MEHHVRATVADERSGSPESDASTISCPPPPKHGTQIPTEPEQEQGASEELAAIQEELQTVLEYIDQGMILKSFDTLSRLTDIAATNCVKLGLASDGGAMDQKAGFWTGLNNCWRFAFLHYGSACSEDQRVREHHLYHLYDKVKTWADALEKYGLVNYELGLGEQDILEAIEVCLINANVFVAPVTADDSDDDDDDDDDDDGDDDDDDDDDDNNNDD
ncbi:hypothetical protein BG011_000641 [Mortierella polycephala]|uniref:Uncharacterized protein n=1 Tax=Mortierella polycephala TaxID=41804 RepID=A0A9P6Q9I6_9FUNG|nr:hypothetical protein BG011_000641 [Mortierella polycephala]